LGAGFGALRAPDRYTLQAFSMTPPTASTILLSDGQIRQRVQELAAQIEQDYTHVDTLHLICVLKGGVMFLTDLVRAMTRPITLDFIALSSYGQSTHSSGEVKLLKDLDTPIAGRDVIIIEDIVDTGLTMTYLQEILRARAPRSLRTACLLSKPSRRQVDVKVEYIGFEIEDRFVVGYGLDFDQRFRNLPHIAVLDEADS
jgi:hypoxanthine phosphoribosyltransferase